MDLAGGEVERSFQSWDQVVAVDRSGFSHDVEP